MTASGEIAIRRMTRDEVVVAMVDAYEKDGGLFLHHTNARYEGTGGGRMPGGLAMIRDVNFADLLACDAKHFPAPRERFLRSWIRQEGHRGIVQLDDRGEICGYGVRRACRTGHTIGQLFARERTTAETIRDGTVAGIPGESFYLDIPVPNAAAVDLVKDRGMLPIFFTARLYSTRDPVPLPLEELFGITTYALG